MFLSKRKGGVYYIFYIDPINERRLSKSTGRKLKKEALEFLTK